MEEIAPTDLAESWDNVGLVIGSPNIVVNKVMVCLDVTSEAVRNAVDNGVNLIISHHPVIFKGLKSINFETPYGELIYNIIKNRINIYSAHTNYDYADKGVNQQLAEALELRQIKPLMEENSCTGAYSRTCELVKTGLLTSPMTMEDFILYIKDKLNVRNVKVAGWREKAVSKVAVFCGSYDPDILEVVMNKSDVLVSGDLKYHHAIEILENKFCVVDAGHFNTEKIMVPNTVRMLRENFTDIEVICHYTEDDPFKYY
ncbi:MAG TPA: Nif3-like dinuclear metal center hexameric protein [Clostridiaceae bacterium]|nr:Nif3-like dinuclear metal center hexameric protein [Clostridiaceae bacterium]